MHSLFSVLLSVYHKENPDYLKTSLDSVFNQTLCPAEVILVEDGPLTEALYQVLDEYAARYRILRRIPLKENRGLGPALNEGLKACSYDLVARMDTDDICLPERFERQIQFMERYPDVDISGTCVTEFCECPSNIIGTRKVPLMHDEITRYIRQRCPFNHPTVIFKKSKVIAAGGYQPFMMEDWWLWGRMLHCGARMANLPESLLLFRTNNDTYKRRGGLSYAVNCLKLQKKFCALHISTRLDMIKCCVIRFSVCLIPNTIRRFLYLNFLREKNGAACHKRTDDAK